MRLTELFQLSPANTDVLETRTRQVVFEKSGPVIHKGQAVSGAYLVMEGELRVYTYSSAGAEATLYLLRPGEICVLTLNCLFNDLRYPAWVEASTNSKVALIPGAIYRQFFAEEPSIRDITVRALSTLVFRLMDELEEVHTCNLEQRLARYLLHNASADGVVYATQQTLANRLATSREVVARLLQGFARHAMIRTGRGKLTLLDEAALAALLAPNDVQWPG